MSGHEQSEGSATASSPRVRASTTVELALDQGWELTQVAAGAADSPAQLEAMQPCWKAAVVPGTVALADPHATGALDAAPQLDACDHWYRCRFERPAFPPNGRVLLRLDGLATLADVFLDGRLLVRSENMFQAHTFDIGAARQPRSELCIRFRALLPVLRQRRPRGRWPTRLVSERNLRFVRTTLLGYMPGFCPTLRPVGPWRGVRLVHERELSVAQVRMQARLDGTRGVLDATLTCRLLASGLPARAELVAGAARAALAIEWLDAEHCVLRGRLYVEDVQPWWPHTHGEPHTYPAHVEVTVGTQSIQLDLGRVGFRSLERAPARAGFGLRVNGEELFCRGACWMPLDVAALHASEAGYRTALEQVRAAGMNMLRLSGTTAYESDAFYRMCDELGILVFQDFMFANMDYPVEHPEFLASCRIEATQFLERVAGRACLAVLCGGSEVAQQAAMMGMGPDTWSNVLFDRVLPDACAEHHPDVPYVPSSPSGGSLPFHTGAGPSHYYGVGAYLRPIDDARLRRVRFASECLAFAIPPEDESLRAWFGAEPVVVHHPRYKARVPRDPGAGWDFADVTDHYLELLFGVPARQLRYSDPERHLVLSRVAVAEAMERVQGFWRRSDSGCNGALIWFLRDLWEGAGLGVIDSGGVAKAPYYALKRAWAPRALWLVDEGTDGLLLHAKNDRPERIDATLELVLYRADGGVIERAEQAVAVDPRGERVFCVEALLGRFVDASYAYRFGPPSHTLVAARLLRESGSSPVEVVARAFHLPLGLAHEPQAEVGLGAAAEALGDGSYAVTVSAQRFAQSVSVEAQGHVPSDNYFHLAPRESHRIVLTPRAAAGAAPPLRGKVRALNASKPAAIRIGQSGQVEPEAR